MDKKFIPYLYKTKEDGTPISIPEIIKEYCDPLLQKSTNVLERNKAIQLLRYRAILLDTEFKSNTQLCFEELFREISKAYPGLSFEIVGRLKALFSVINKLEALEYKKINELKLKFISTKYSSELETLESKELQKKLLDDKLAILNESASQKNSFQKEFSERLSDKKFVGENIFDRVHDYFAFRVLLEDIYPEELIDTLDEVSNLIIEFFVNKGFEILEHSQLIETGKIEKHPLIYVPKTSLIRYSKLVKDYVRKPKTSGYQGIHIVVVDPYSEREFEIQIRTRSMDLVANTLASHTSYKLSKYYDQQLEEKSIDYSSIKVRGFRYIKYIDPITKKEKEYFSDNAGLKDSKSLFSKKSG